MWFKTLGLLIAVSVLATGFLELAVAGLFGLRMVLALLVY